MFLAQYPKRTGNIIPLTEVILDFSILTGTKPQILTPKRYNEHPLTGGSNLVAL